MAQRSQLVHTGKGEVLSVRSLKAYFLVTKPATVWLLVFTGAVGFAAASQSGFLNTSFPLLLFALTLSCAGANTLTCYVDRDIDLIMERTRHRPIPSLQISPGRAMAFGLTLVALGLATSLYINLLTFTLVLLGLVNNVLMYSLWTKRRTPFNILIGSFSGGLPAMAGYAAYAGSIDLKSILLGAIVVSWTPVHIWSVALRYRQDYAEAKVPMLPVIVTESRAVKLIGLASIISVIVSLLPVALHLFGAVYLYSAAVLGIGMLLLSLWLMIKPKGTRAWLVFKVSGLYLGLLFLAILLDSLLVA